MATSPEKAEDPGSGTLAGGPAGADPGTCSGSGFDSGAEPAMPLPAWRGRGTWQLVVDAVQGPPGLGARLGRPLGILSGYFGDKRVRERLERLKARGHIEQVPSHWQILLAGYHNMLGTAAEETKVYYRDIGVNFTFHNTRRFLAEPSTMMDAVGFFSDLDTIIHHIFQTFHRHPVYDFQLCEGFDGGIEELVRQAKQIVDGVHPQQRQLESLIEDPTYHPRVYEQILEFADDPFLKPIPLDYPYDADPLLRLAMEQFATVGGFCHYACQLEDAGPVALAKALRPGAPPFRINPAHCNVRGQAHPP